MWHNYFRFAVRIWRHCLKLIVVMLGHYLRFIVLIWHWFPRLLVVVRYYSFRFRSVPCLGF